MSDTSREEKTLILSARTSAKETQKKKKQRFVLLYVLKCLPWQFSLSELYFYAICKTLGSGRSISLFFDVVAYKSG